MERLDTQMPENLATLSELAEYFLREAAKFHTKGQGPVDERAAYPLVDAWASLLERSRSASLDTVDLQSVLEAGREAAEAYENYKKSTGENKADALSAMRGYLDAFLYLLNEGRLSGLTADEITAYRAKIVDAGEESERLMSILAYVTARTTGLDAAVEEAQTAAREATQAVSLARKAATEASTSTLERSFNATARASARAASWFRGFTVGVLALIVVLGGWFATTHAPSGENQVDWYGIVYRVAVLSGLAALAAYLAGQAAHYRRLATWAQGIEIQLKAFLGFVNEVQDEDSRQALTTLFGKRVLEAPPDGKASSDDSVTNLFQPVFDHVLKVRPPTA